MLFRVATLAIVVTSSGCGLELDFNFCGDQGCPDYVVTPRPLGSGDDVLIDAVAQWGTATYTAAGYETDVQADGPLDILEADTGHLLVQGTAPGTGTLTVERDGVRGALTVDVGAVDRVVVLPRTEAFHAVDEQVPYAQLAGSEVELIVRLYDAAGRRLHDELVNVTGGDGQLVRGDYWDVFVMPSAPRSIEAVTASGAAGGADIARLNSIDDIGLLSVWGPDEFDRHQFCFVGLSNGEIVAGVDDWLYWELDGIVPVDGSKARGGCAPVYTERTKAVRIRTGDIERTFDLTADTLFGDNPLVDRFDRPETR